MLRHSDVEVPSPDPSPSSSSSYAWPGLVEIPTRRHPPQAPARGPASSSSRHAVGFVELPRFLNSGMLRRELASWQPALVALSVPGRPWSLSSLHASVAAYDESKRREGGGRVVGETVGCRGVGVEAQLVTASARSRRERRGHRRALERRQLNETVAAEHGVDWPEVPQRRPDTATTAAAGLRRGELMLLILRPRRTTATT